MAIFRMFCFSFSIPLGCIIIGIISAIQASICLMISVVNLGNIDELKLVLKDSTNALSITNVTLLKILESPEPVIITLVIYFGLFLLSTILLITAAVKCVRFLIFPFILLDAIYLVILLLLLVFFMMNFKANGINLGLLILYCNIGCFIILFLLYLWFTAVSFSQILRELNQRVAEQIILGNLYENQNKNILATYNTSYAGLSLRY